jgi:hypothetical protein
VSTGVLALCLRASRSPPPLVTCLAENIRQRANTTGAPLAYVSPASDRQAIINELIVLFDGPAQGKAKGLRLRRSGTTRNGNIGVGERRDQAVSGGRDRRFCQAAGPERARRLPAVAVTGSRQGRLSGRMAAGAAGAGISSQPDDAPAQDRARLLGAC